MSNPHPITPPDKQLVRKWIEDWAGGQMKGPVTDDQLIVATQSTQYGADQQLEECCEQLKSIPSPLGIPFGEMASNALRNACRPKPPSLKEQALEQLCEVNAMLQFHTTGGETSVIRKALEALPND